MGCLCHPRKVDRFDVGRAQRCSISTNTPQQGILDTPSCSPSPSPFPSALLHSADHPFVATALARDLTEMTLGKRVIELGAGCGLPSVAALRHAEASHVKATDIFKHTLDNLRCSIPPPASSKRTRMPANCPIMCGPHLKKGDCRCNLEAAAPGGHPLSWSVEELDWGARAWEHAGSWDFIVGSDLVYDREHVPSLVRVATALASPRGCTFLYCAPKVRDGLVPFLEQMEEAGWSVSTSEAPPEYYDNPLAVRPRCKSTRSHSQHQCNKFGIFSLSPVRLAFLLQSQGPSPLHIFMKVS
jgi:predicted nicotinamide N-methyase